MFAAVTAGPATLPQIHWAQLVLDVNSDASNVNPFAKEQLVSIWSELKVSFNELSQGYK
jgi:hypothetical protein